MRMKYKNYKEVSKSIREITKRALTRGDLEKRIIIQRGGKYQAYGDYIIEENQSGWQLSSPFLNELIMFTTAKAALAWLISFKAGKIELANNIHWIDSRITAKQSDIDVLAYALGNATATTNTAILLARLTEDINSRQTYKKQLAKFVNIARRSNFKPTSY